MKNKKMSIFSKTLSIVKRRYGQLLLTIILISISILSIKYGEYLLSNDNYSPELNPLMSFFRYLESPAWRSYRVLGFASDSEQSDIFRSLIYWLSSFALPSWSLSQLFSLVCLWVGSFSIASLTTRIVRENINTKYYNIVFVVSGTIYVTTLWTAWVFNFNMMPYITQYGFLPLVLLTGYILLKDWNSKNILFFLLSTLLLTSTFVISTLFFVNILFISIIFAVFSYLGKIDFKRFFLSILLFLSMQLFWLLPFIQYTVSTSSDVIDSYTNRTITSNTIDLEKQMMTFVNSARFYTRLLGTVDDPSIDSYIFPMSEEYIGYDFYKAVALLPFVLSVIGLTFILFQRRWRLIPIWVMLFGALLMITNLNPPFGFVYAFLQENFGIFTQVFRWVSSKLGQIYLVLLVITGAIGFVSLLEFWGSFLQKGSRRLLSILLLLLFLGPILFFSEYIVKGDLFTKRATVELPNQYYELAKYLEKDPSGRIFYAPPANNGYFREYEWGFVGSQFLGYIIPNPIIDMSLAVGSDVGEKAVLEIKNSFNSGNLQELNYDLNKYDVKYILVDRSLIKGRYGHEMNWESLEEFLSDKELLWSSGTLELYEFTKTLRRDISETLDDSDRSVKSYFKREIPKDPRMNIFSLDMKGAVYENGYLSKPFIYQGEDTRIYSNIDDIDINLLPTRWQIKGGVVEVRPLLPNINDVEIEVFKTFSTFLSDGYYILGNKVYSSSDLLEGVNSSILWKDISALSFVRGNTVEKIDLTNTFAELEGNDCSGEEFAILPSVEKGINSSGFVLFGSTDLPCVYEKIKLTGEKDFIGKLEINWESSEGNHLGFCLYSQEKGDCINKSKFLYAKNGFGETSYLFPSVISGKDDLSLTIYGLNAKGEKTSVTVKKLAISFSSDIESIPVTTTNQGETSKIVSLDKNEVYMVNIPIIDSESSYIYDYKLNESLLWQPSLAEDSTLLYSVSAEDGMKQEVFNQYMNQYQKLLKTTSQNKYLWYWRGENISNIPATLCLTYSGDDKCWLDDTFYPDIESSASQMFAPSENGYENLEASYNSISFASDSVNVLKTFLVIPVPSEWFNFNYSPIISDEYEEVEAEAISNSPHSTIYRYERTEDKKYILTIPQSKSQGWIAVKIGNGSFGILEEKDIVYVDGWKQGWDIYDVGDFDQIYIFYWPNLLSYFGYFVILLVLSFTLISLFKEKNKYGKN